MNLTLRPGKLQSTIQIPGSKSYANRLLILAALKKAPVTLASMPDATDVTHLISALKEVGLHFTSDHQYLVIENSFPACETSPKEISVGEGGTTARFLACMLLLGSQKYTLVLGERLKERPWQEFLDLVNGFGAKAKLTGNKLELQGPLNLPESLDVDCSRTTQFASGLQLAFAFHANKIVPKNMKSSESYWKMTEDLISSIKQHNFFSVPLDWSSASYPMAFAALNQEIHFPGLIYDSFQADAKFLEILKKFDAITENGQGIIVKPIKKAISLSWDVSDCLDLVPTLGYFLAHCPGTHELSGISNLVHKESNRLDGVIKLLQIYDRKGEVVGDKLIIHGRDQRETLTQNLELPDDHRMVMAATLFLLHHAGGNLKPAEAVKKSYPGFFDIILNS